MSVTSTPTTTLDAKAPAGEAPLTLTTEPPRPLGFTDQLAMWGNLGISLFGPRELVLTELNAQQAPKQTMQAETAMAAVANGKDGSDEPHDPNSIN